MFSAPWRFSSWKSPEDLTNKQTKIKLIPFLSLWERIIGWSLCTQVPVRSCFCKGKVKSVLSQRRPALTNSMVAPHDFVFTVMWAQVPYFPCGLAVKIWVFHSGDVDRTCGGDHFGRKTEGRLLSEASSLPKAIHTDVGCYKAGSLLPNFFISELQNVPGTWMLLVKKNVNAVFKRVRLGTPSSDY